MCYQHGVNTLASHFLHPKDGCIPARDVDLDHLVHQFIFDVSLGASLQRTLRTGPFIVLQRQKQTSTLCPLREALSRTVLSWLQGIFSASFICSRQHSFIEQVFSSIKSQPVSAAHCMLGHPFGKLPLLRSE